MIWFFDNMVAYIWVAYILGPPCMQIEFKLAVLICRCLYAPDDSVVPRWHNPPRQKVHPRQHLTASSDAPVFQPSAIELFRLPLSDCGTLCRWTSRRRRHWRFSKRLKTHLFNRSSQSSVVSAHWLHHFGSSDIVDALLLTYWHFLCLYTVHSGPSSVSNTLATLKFMTDWLINWLILIDYCFFAVAISLASGE